MFSKFINRLKKLHKKEEQKSGWDQEKMDKVGPVAEEVLKIIAKNPFPYSDKDNWEEVSKAIRQPVKDILELYLSNNLLLQDLQLVKVMINTKIDRIEQSINDSLNQSSEFIETQLYGCPKRELDFKTLDVILKDLYTNIQPTEKNEEVIK